MNPQAFVAKWRAAVLKERAAAQEHFLDICALLGHPTPAEDDPTGHRFAFEAGVDKQSGGQGFADVWKRGYLRLGVQGQARQPRRRLPATAPVPGIAGESAAAGGVRHRYASSSTPTSPTPSNRSSASRWTICSRRRGYARCRAIFYGPDAFRSTQTTEQVTAPPPSNSPRLAEHLRQWGEQPERIAHFLIRLLFCLFAEDIDLLPKTLFSRLVEMGRREPARFNQQLRRLFQAMAEGDVFGVDAISHFDGGLFDDGSALDLDREGLEILHHVTDLDWSAIEPSIFGTLFERSLDPEKRSQLGAHYTSKDDILLIVEPVLMAPLRREWAGGQGAGAGVGAEAQRGRHGIGALTLSERPGAADRRLHA